MDANPLADKALPSLDEVREDVAKLKHRKVAGVCNISVEMLILESEAMTCRLHAILPSVWQCGTIPHDWKRGASCPYLEH